MRGTGLKEEFAKEKAFARADGLTDTDEFASAEALKKAAREKGKAGRNSLAADERKRLSEMICRAIISSEEYRRSGILMIYKAAKGEASLECLEKQAAKDGKKTAYPLCVSETEMKALSPYSAESFEKGCFGIDEPLREESEEIRPEDIDFVICPCAAFDEACRRVGMGKGYYDRYLSLCVNAKTAAAAFEIQKADIAPAESWDVPMDKIFTERAVYVRNEDTFGKII